MKGRRRVGVVLAVCLTSLLAMGTGVASATPVSCTTGSFDVIDHVVSNGGGAGGSGNCEGTAPIPADVTSIDTGAFAAAAGLTAVTFAEGSQLTSIGQNAFHDATGLASITIPSGVTTIGTGAFSGATQLSSVTFASGSQLTSIGINAFIDARSLTSIEIPSGVTSIGDAAFRIVTGPPGGLTTITFAPGSQLTSIGEQAFQDTNLARITIPSGVTSIGSNAFLGATQLSSVTFASGSQLTTIGSDAFTNATSLTGIEIPSGVTSIDVNAFLDATQLRSVTFAAGSQLTSIGDNAFGGASSLTSIVIPSGVTSIGDGAFSRTSSLTTVTFAPGSQLTRIRTQMLQGAVGLRTLTFAAGSRLVGIDDYAFAGLANLRSVALPSGLTSIGIQSFRQTGLQSITIPASVTSIGSVAFGLASSLSSVIFEGNAPTVGDAAFLGVAEGATAYRSAPATGFDVSGDPPRWNGLRVAVYLATPPAPVATAGVLSATVAAQAAATGPAVSSLLVTASPGGASCVVSGASGSCTVTGLMAGTAYTFTAVARSASPSSESEASAASAGVTVMASLRTAKPKVVANGVAVDFTASGPGTATASGVVAGAKFGVRAEMVVCTGTLRVKKAGKVRLVCTLNAAGRTLRRKGALKVVLTTRFVPKKGAVAVSTRTVTIPRRR